MNNAASDTDQPAMTDLYDNSSDKRTIMKKLFMRFALLMAAILFLFAAGFAVFLVQINGYLKASDDSLRADGIVVLTGGYARLEPAVDLLREKRGERLLISGVNRKTSDNLLKDVLDINDALYDCCVDVDQDALDTIGNAIGTAHWVSSKNYQSIIVVTNDYHMPRSIAELSRTLPNVKLVPYAVRNEPQENRTIAQELDQYRVLMGEYVKYLASLMRGVFSSQKQIGSINKAGMSTGW